jgi:hypothetical protein
MTAREHARLLGIFHIVQACLQIFTGLIIFVLYAGIGGVFMASAGREEEQIFGGIFVGLAFVLIIVMIPFALLYGYSGWKLFKGQPHSKVWPIVVSIMCLPGIPLGTALGIYGLWFVFGEEGKLFYDGEISRTANNYAPPPPPNSWQ